MAPARSQGRSFRACPDKRIAPCEGCIERPRRSIRLHPRGAPGCTDRMRSRSPSSSRPCWPGRCARRPTPVSPLHRGAGRRGATATRPLEKALAKSRDPLLLFEQAIAHGQLCERERTLRSLSALARTWGGLDPGNFRGFAFLRGDPGFDALVGDIRARNRPVLSSQPGYVFPEPDLFPEGMAFDGRTGRVYAGSAATQRIVWTDRSGALHELVPARAGGLGFPAG